jgi:ABC-type branched-subunit amino acid transport system substrate-binding protein
MAAAKESRMKHLCQALRRFRHSGALALLAGTLALAGCGGTTGYYDSVGDYVPSRAPQAVRTQPAKPANALPPLPGNTASTTAPSGARVALLAPLTGPNADRGTALAQAAQLALAVPGSPALDVIDTHGTPEGAAAAASQAIAGGAGLILGPLTAQETAAAAGPATAAGVGMLAFTSDAAQQRPGVWVLGLTPEQQVRRLVNASVAQGRQHFAALLPANDFGHALSDALLQASLAAGAGSPDIRTVGDGMQAANAAVRDLSQYGARRGPFDAQIKAARALQTPEGRKTAAELAKRPIPPAPFDALLLGATGEPLSEIASLLPYYDIDSPAVRLLGPALWANPDARVGVNLNGAWYAAPDPAARSSFDQQYSAKYGTPAPGLADLAYDAAAIARVTASAGGFSQASLTRPEGFAGVDGVLGLQADGSVRRGLALFEIQRGGVQMIEPSPETLGAPGT